ncbi:MAG: TlpA family protein disulfide reductase [Alcanivorax sp.]
MSTDKPVLKTIKLLFPTLIIPIIWILINAGMFDNVTASTSKMPTPWPPQLKKPFPNLDLIDQEGMEFKLSYLKGKVIVVEPIGMNCPACQAFSGGHTYGPYQNNAVANGLTDFEKLFETYSGGKLRLPHRDVVFIQLLLYDMRLEAPDKEDAKNWAKHFHISKANNHFVAVLPYDARGRASFDMIPGFYLIDRNFILQSDSTGHHPKHNLYKHLIPMVPKLVRE